MLNGGTLRVATQNIQWGGDPAPGGDGNPRLTRLIPHLTRQNADVLVLTEHKSGRRGNELALLLQDSGYQYLLHRTPGPPALGTAIASRLPVTEIELPIRSDNESWRSLAVRVVGVDVVGFYFPLRDAKAPYWDWVLANAAAMLDRDVLLIGDFNTGKQGIDEVGRTLDSAEKQAALEDIGFVDTWRAANPEGRDYTWFSSAGNGFRLDYIWASPSLAHRVKSIYHDHEARLSGASDHAAVITEIALPLPVDGSDA